MTYSRDNLKNKKVYYLSIILVEFVIYFSLFFFNVHWLILTLIFPFLIIELISNKRCLNRQKNFIKSIEFTDNQIICTHLKNNKTEIPHEKLIFSFREIKFEKDRSEIEIKLKGNYRNKLIGRIHIKNWKNIFEIKDELIKRKVTRVKFKPEGFWSKYGGLTADVVILTSTLTFSEVAEATGDFQDATDLKQIAFSTDLHKKKQ
ncbi:MULTISPECIES: hypothetical protein [Flavobacterium]|uniref:hypothetical protein n=1 Tax=Flavobacterium TaxID=237 RepID=UPI001FCBABD0|nr:MULTISPECIES: hypothetical protein [Flavobacterium]UOK42173.1 hypothetical protein LZF87_12745 [Flavobacterium enshiense]